MSNQFRALQLYFNNKNIPLMISTEFMYLKRAGYKINGKEISLSDHEKIIDLSSRAEKEANEIMSKIYETIKDDPIVKKYCKHINTSIEKKKIGWSFTLQMKDNSRKKTKMHYSITVELDFDYDASPAIIANLWCPKALGKQINIWR